MPCNGYIAGRPVSHWDADTDNIDIDYRTLGGHHSLCEACSHCVHKRKGGIVKVLVMVITFLLGFLVSYLVLRAHYGNTYMQITTHKDCSSYKPSGHYIQDYNATVATAVQSRLGVRGNYKQHIVAMSDLVNWAGSAHTLRILYDYVKKRWDKLGFDRVDISKYKVDLSYPKLEKLSYVSVGLPNGTEWLRSHTNVTSEHLEYLPFNAYSPSQTVTSQLVYAHYGRQGDFKALRDLGVVVRGNIVLIRYGITHPSEKVMTAEQNGAVGVIFYCDPGDYSQPPTHGRASSLPPWAAKSAQVAFIMAGARYTSQGGEIKLSNSSYPKIPSQPISYNDAKNLLNLLNGSSPSPVFNVSHALGPGFTLQNASVTVAVYNTLTHRPICNAVAIIYGSIDKDKYVIVGAHHDSWAFGAVDVGTSVAVLMELARSFTLQTQQGWRPRRTIIFALWGGSKYGHMGAYNWVQRYSEEVSEGAVAYINLDAAVVGDYSLWCESNPMLRDLILHAASSIPAPESDPALESDPRSASVLAHWAEYFPGVDNTSLPRLPYPGADGDHAPFEYMMGVPTASPSYTYDRNAMPRLLAYPVAGTLADTFSHIHTDVDPDMARHETIAKLVAGVIVQLADSRVLPLSPTGYLGVLYHYWVVMQYYREEFESQDISLLNLKQTIDRCAGAIDSFSAKLSSLNVSTTSETEVDNINHKLMRLTRLFVRKSPLSNTHIFRHPEAIKAHVVLTFDVKQAIAAARQLSDWTPIHDWLAEFLPALDSVARLLNDTPFM